jgi:hypothetical protein
VHCAHCKALSNAKDVKHVSSSIAGFHHVCMLVCLLCSGVFSREVIARGLCWSDPCDEKGFHYNTKRNTGCLWGPDKTMEFLKLNSLKLIIRSHEVGSTAAAVAVKT